RDYNRLLVDYRDELRKIRRDADTNPPLDVQLPADLNLVKQLAGDAWPDEFILIVGTNGIGCGSDSPPSWSFWYTSRAVGLDTLLVENASSEAIGLEGLLGSRSGERSFRPIGSEVAPGADLLPSDLPATRLEPGKRILVPISITFLAPHDD